MIARVLIMAGSDPSGGAGIQADIKTVTVLKGYAMSVITALTAQNTQGVFGIHDVPIDFIRQQFELVIDDIGADALKTGMLSQPEVIELLAELITEKAKGIPFVLDPVMVAKGGAALLQPSAMTALTQKLMPLASVVTPNIPEAEMLVGYKIQDGEAMVRAAQEIRQKFGPQAVLIKGGHAQADVLTDYLVTQNDVTSWSNPHIKTVHTHGTGCSLASAIATGLAQKLSLKDSVDRAIAFIHAAIAGAPKLGQGHGPIAHGIFL